MHCVHLGIVKKLLSFMFLDKNKDKELYSKISTWVLTDRIDQFQRVLDDMCKNLPDDLEKTPSRFLFYIGNGKASDFKCFLMLAPALMNICGGVSIQMQNLWSILLRIVTIACSKCIPRYKLEELKDLEIQFFVQFRDMFGGEQLSLNLHMLLHVHDSVERFGPMCHYWLYAYERLNGVLSNFVTSNRSSSLHSEMLFQFRKLHYVSSIPGLHSKQLDSLNLFDLQQTLEQDGTNVCNLIASVGKTKSAFLTTHDMSILKEHYKLITGSRNAEMEVCFEITVHSKLQFGRETYKSGSCISADFLEEDRNGAESQVEYYGICETLFSHVFDKKEYFFAKVKYFRTTGVSDYVIKCSNSFYASSGNDFLPITRFKNRFLMLKDATGGGVKLVKLRRKTI